MRTESGNPHEWPYIGSVVLNRVDRPQWDNTIKDVVRQYKHFSAFNPTVDMDDAEAWNVLANKYPAQQLSPAVACAEWLLSLDPEERPTQADHFWAPRSMVPKWVPPKWAFSLKDLHTPREVSPLRLVLGTA